MGVVIIGLILLILYFFAGHDFAKFYFGGKSEILEAAEHINKLCNADGKCPTTLEGWRESHTAGNLVKGNMFYFVTPEEGVKGSGEKNKNQTFRLIYRFSVPDHWFEVKGGVGRKVTSGWTGR